MKHLCGIVVSIFLAAATMAPATLQAGSINLTNVISGATPAGSAPWMNASFQDVSPDTVRLTVDNIGLTGIENVNALFLNLNPALDPTSLTFSFVSQNGGFDLPTILEAVDSYKADGDGYYDIRLDFSQGGQSHRFTAGQSIIYDITGISGLTASDFSFISMEGGGQGQYYVAAQIQQIGPESGWIGATTVTEINAVPEPSALALGALGVSLMIIYRRRKCSV